MVKEKIKLIKITKLKSDDKKYSAEFEVIKPSGKISKKTTKFGAAGMSDFTKHKDTERRERYISRHKKDLKTGNPIRAGYLSMYILWNKKSFSESVSDYKRRLNIYNKTGKFPTKISGSKLLNSFGTLLDVSPSDKLTLENANTIYHKERLKKLNKLFFELKKRAEQNAIKYVKNENSDLYKNELQYNFFILGTWTSKWMEKFANICLKRDFDPIKRNIWWQIVNYLLKAMSKFEENEDPYEFLPEEDFEKYEKTREAIIKILRKCEYKIIKKNKEVLFSYDDIDEGWGAKASIWWETKFGKKTKFGIPLSNIPFEETTLKKLPSDIQRRIEKDVIKYNLDQKLSNMQLKNFLTKIRDENVDKKNLPLYKVLDITDINTINFLKLATKSLKRSDFTSNSLWTKVILNLLDKLNDIKPFNTLNLEEIDKVLNTVRQLVIFFKKVFNLYFDFDDDRGVWWGGTFENRKGFELINNVNDEEFIKLIIQPETKFGKKTKFGTPVSNIPFKETSLKVLPDEIQHKIEREVFKKNMNLKNVDKMQLKNYLMKIKAENVNLRYVPLYRVLDEGDISTVIWLKLANKILKKNDFTINSLWTKIIINLLEEIESLRPYDNPRLNEHEFGIIEATINQIELLLMSKFNIYIDFESERGDWAEIAKIELKEKINEDNYEQNYFGNYFSHFGITKNLNKHKELTKIPDNVMNKPLYLRIKNKIKKEIGNKRRWGAYDSGRLVREYKAKGGKYSEKSSNKSSDLSRWYKEKWIDACAWPKRKSCGRTKETIKNKVTYCRPSIRVDKNTPKTVLELSKSIIKKRCKNKSKNPKKIIINK